MNQKRGRGKFLLVLFLLAVSIMLAFSAVAARVNIGIYNTTGGKFTIVARVSNPGGGGGDDGGGCEGADCAPLPAAAVPPAPAVTEVTPTETEPATETATGGTGQESKVAKPAPNTQIQTFNAFIGAVSKGALADWYAYGPGACDSRCESVLSAASLYVDGQFDAAKQELQSAGIDVDSYPGDAFSTDFGTTEGISGEEGVTGGDTGVDAGGEPSSEESSSEVVE